MQRWHPPADCPRTSGFAGPAWTPCVLRLVHHSPGLGNRTGALGRRPRRGEGIGRARVSRGVLGSGSSPATNLEGLAPFIGLTNRSSPYHRPCAWVEVAAAWFRVGACKGGTLPQAAPGHPLRGPARMLCILALPYRRAFGSGSSPATRMERPERKKGPWSGPLGLVEVATTKLQFQLNQNTMVVNQ